MITGELKSRVDRIWDTMWSGGISNPLSVIEQLTYLLFIKRLDELHTREEHKAARTRRPIEKPLFTARQDALRWSRFKELAPEQMFETVRDQVFPFIKSLRQTGDADEGSTYTDHMKDALFMMPTARVLANVVDQLDDIDMADRDTKGDLYEYMLGKIATAGQNGQFRTPRHIIKLMVDMTAPTPKDVICDPACGTAGFLVAASEHLVEHHADRIYKNARARRRFNEGTFHGYDFDTTMLRIGSMNMLLHGVENPDIRYRDSLAQTDLAATGDDAERYSLVLANPPFSGQSRLRVHCQGPAAGRQDEEDRDVVCWPCSCACCRLAAAPPSSYPTVYSSGRAKRTGPCAGFWSRSRSSTPSSPCPPASSNPMLASPPPSCSSPRLTLEAPNNVWFFDMQADGYSLDDKRTPQPESSDLADILARWRNREAERKRARTHQSFLVPKAEIAGNDYDLSINRYKEMAYEAVEYDPPMVIMGRLGKMETEIAEGLVELEGMLR